ncbi:MAG: hypothetical protein ACKVOR_01120 [Flavobacteriales bacterium]
MLFDNLKRYQKRLIASVSFVFALLVSNGQGGFNLRFIVDDRTQLQSVNCSVDSTFIVAGYTADSETGDHLDFVMLEFDMQGNLLNEATIETPGCFTNIYEEGDSYVGGLYIQHEQAIYENVYAHRLFWYNNELDTLFTKFVQSPYKDSLWDDAEFMYSQYAVLAPDSCLFYSFGVWKPETTGNDVCIKKYSPNGHELWTYIYESDAEVDVCYSILPQPGGGGGLPLLKVFGKKTITNTHALRKLMNSVMKNGCLIQEMCSMVHTSVNLLFKMEMRLSQQALITI